MQTNSLNIYIISEDLMFIKLIETMLERFTIEANIEKISTFIEIVNKDYSNPPDIIILDDIISGATILEVISYLRLNKRLLSTICFFSIDVYDIKTKAYERGVNYFYNKPFDPKAVVLEIINNFNSSIKNTKLSAK